MLTAVVAALGNMYLISGQAHLRLQPAVTLVAAHTKLSLYTVQCMVGKNAFVPQISVGKGAKGLFRAAISRAVHKLRNDESFLSSLHEN